jgi:hypothetical protein
MLCFSIHLIFSDDLMVGNIDMQFSTIDVDNDMLNGKSCAAKVSRGGWWYVNCGFTNLNKMIDDQQYLARNTSFDMKENRNK